MPSLFDGLFSRFTGGAHHDNLITFFRGEHFKDFNLLLVAQTLEFAVRSERKISGNLRLVQFSDVAPEIVQQEFVVFKRCYDRYKYAG